MSEKKRVKRQNLEALEVFENDIIAAIKKNVDLYDLTYGEIIQTLEIIKLNYYMETQNIDGENDNAAWK